MNDLNCGQDAISYLIALFITLPESVTDEIVIKLQDLDIAGYFSLLMEDGLCNFLKPILDSEGIVYDDNLLKTYLGKANQLIVAKITLISIFVSTDSIGINQDTLNNILRIAYMHLPETVYALIK